MKKGKMHYGWVIVIACFFITMFIQLETNTWSYFQMPVCEDLGCSYVQFSTSSAIATIASMIFGLTMASKIGRGKLRMFMLFGGIIAGAAWFAQAYITQIWHIYITYFVINFALGTMLYIPINILMTNWFIDKKAFALSMALMGSGIGQMLFSNVIANYISTQGWRALTQVYGIVTIAATFVVVLLIRKTPAEKGLEAYRQADKKADATAAPKAMWMGLTKAEAMKTSTFWVFVVVVVCVGMIASGVMSQVPTYLTENELPYATVMVVYSVFMIINKITIGPLFDKKGTVWGIVMCSVLLLGAFVGLLLVPSGGMWAYVGIALFGLGAAVASLAPPLLVSNLFGVKDYGGIYGFANFFFYGGCMIGPILTSAIRTATGNYMIAWIVYIAVAIIMVAATLLASKMSKALKEKYPN